MMNKYFTKIIMSSLYVGIWRAWDINKLIRVLGRITHLTVLRLTIEFKQHHLSTYLKVIQSQLILLILNIQVSILSLFINFHFLKLITHRYQIM